MRKKRKLLFIIMTSFLLVTAIAISLFSISKSRSFQFFGTIYSSFPNDEKKIALTFDDGPSANTQLIIKKLKELDIPATFFVCGAEIYQKPEEAKALVDAGYDLSNHSYSHKRMLLKSYLFCKEELERTNELIRDSGYTGEIFFRPPYGKKLFVLPFYLNKVDMPCIMWDIEPETVLGFDATAVEIADYTINNVQSGSIILLHPMFNPENILPALEIIVSSLQEKGYTFCTVAQLITNNNGR